MTEWLNRCHFGDVRAVLRRMIADGVKVNAIVTSPPYWGLRSYLPDDHPDKHLELGHEPTLVEFIQTQVSIFDLARQVLADDGTMWVNMGDCYITHGGMTNTPSSENTGQAAPAIAQANRTPQPNLKPKDMAGQPWRLAIALQDAGWWLRSDIIWNKPNPMPESTRDRPTKAHEYLFLLAKSESYYFNFEAWKEPVTGGAHARRASNGVGFGHGFDAIPKPRVKADDVPTGWDVGNGRPHTQKVGRYPSTPKAALASSKAGAYVDGKGDRLGRGAGWREVKNNESFADATPDMPTTRNRRTVWTINTEGYKGSHFATYPRELVRPCLLAGVPPGGVVLDLYHGSGTTGQVAQELGFDWIGIDLDRRNEPLQLERIGPQPALRLHVEAS